MILYLDTSALVKLYVEESGSDAIGAAVDAADLVATVRISYAEARAAFARHAREGGVTAAELRRIVRHLDEEWGHYSVVEVTDGLVRRAGALAERHALRGYDAVQLAALVTLRLAGGEIMLSSFDDRLTKAARREKVRIAASA